MTRHELVALLPGPGPTEGPSGCRLVSAEGYVSVLGRTGALPALRRADVLRTAADRARTLEALLPYGTVLPVLPGHRLREDEVRRLVRANRALLDSVEANLRGRVQFQVTVRWPADRAGEAFGLGAQGLDALAGRLRARIADRLAATGAEIAQLPIAGDVLTNMALLVPAKAEAALDAAVAEVDAIWSDGFAIRLIGPYPAVSFASLAFDRVEPGAVRDALGTFGLAPGFGEEELRAARRAVLMRADPDARRTLDRQSELLACVARLGEARAAVHVARVWSEGRSAPTGPEVWAA